MNIAYKLVFIHGAGGNPLFWQYQTRFFPGSIALALPGHPHGNGFSNIDDYADWVVRKVEQGGWTDIVLCGHSMGGAIAQTVALRHPSFLKAIVLVGTGAKLRVSPQVFQTLEADYSRAVDLILDLAFGPQAPPDLVAGSRKPMLEVSPGVTYDDFRACDRFDRMREVANINVPALVICGSDDALTPPKYSEYLAEQIPGALLKVIPGAGHMLPLEKPGDFNAALQEFLIAL